MMQPGSELWQLAKQVEDDLGLAQRMAEDPSAELRRAAGRANERHRTGRRQALLAAWHRFSANWHERLEVLSFVVLILGGPLAFYSLKHQLDQEAVARAESAAQANENARQARVALAEGVYSEVDRRYVDFVKLCMDHSDLDCYSARLDPPPKLDDRQTRQQHMLFTALTDVFEVAYVEYHKKDVDPQTAVLFDGQWKGWDSYIRKFAVRASYQLVWHDIRDEYDPGLVAFMDGVIPQGSVH